MIADRGSVRTILVADDDSTLVACLADTLELAGYDVLTATSAAEARAVSAGAQGIDLVLADVVMPEAGGRDLVDQLRAQRPRLKALYMSGYPRIRLEGRGLIVREHEFLAKPFELEEMLARVRALLGQNGECPSP